MSETDSPRIESRAYIGDDNSDYAKLTHFFAIKNNTIHLEVFGLNGKEITKYWEDVVLDSKQIKSVRFEWNNLRNIQDKELLEYISIHPKECVFRLKTNISNSKYPIKDKELTGFFDIRIYPDLPNYYNKKVSAEELKVPYEKLNVTPSRYDFINLYFAVDGNCVQNHPFAGDLVKNEYGHKKGWCGSFINTITVPESFFESRPRGTFLLFLFHLKNGKYLSRALVFGSS